MKGKKPKNQQEKKPLCNYFFFNCIEFLQFSSVLTLKEMFENKEMPTNSKAQMAFNTWPHVPMRLQILLAVRDPRVLRSATGSRQGWVCLWWDWVWDPK